MNPVLAQWLPAIFMILAIWVGLIYNNKRLDDFKDLLRDEVHAATNELRIEIAEAKGELRSEISDSHRQLEAARVQSDERILKAIADLKSDIQGLDRRLQRLEAPLLRG